MRQGLVALGITLGALAIPAGANASEYHCPSSTHTNGEETVAYREVVLYVPAHSRLFAGTRLSHQRFACQFALGEAKFIAPLGAPNNLNPHAGVASASCSTWPEGYEAPAPFKPWEFYCDGWRGRWELTFKTVEEA